MTKLAKRFVLIGFVLLFAGISGCLAQNSSMIDYTKKGRVISREESSNTGEVVAYRLEIIRLAKPFDMGDGKPPIDRAFRLVFVTKEDLSLADFSIWMNDSPYQAIQIKSNELAILIYGRTLPSQTLKLGLSKRGKNALADRTVLGGTLNVPSEYATPIEEILANNPIIRLRRIPPTNRGIELRIEVPRIPCQTAAIPVSIEIDGQMQNTFCDGRAYISWFSPEEFAQLRNGAEIKLRRGGGRNAQPFLVIGLLDKGAVL